MRKYFLTILVLTILLTACTTNPERDTSNSTDSSEDSYDDGYEWATENDINDFDKCQDQFGTSEAEDGCNSYVKDNHTGSKSFSGYECTEDCGGHEAGYKWAEKKDIKDSADCDGNSESFNEGCKSYVEKTYRDID